MKVREPNIADYYASRIGKKEINEVKIYIGFLALFGKTLTMSNNGTNFGFLSSDAQAPLGMATMNQETSSMNIFVPL